MVGAACCLATNLHGIVCRGRCLCGVSMLTAQFKWVNSLFTQGCGLCSVFSDAKRGAKTAYHISEAQLSSISCGRHSYAYKSPSAPIVSKGPYIRSKQ